MPSVRQRKRRNGCGKILRAAIEAMEARVLLSTYTVNTFVDRVDPTSSHTVNLRDALALAAAHAGPDTVNVPAGSYKLTLDELFVNDSTGSLTIQSTGGAVTIDAQHLSRVLEVAAGSSVNVSGLTITGGTGTTGVAAGAPSGGGGIANEGTLSISNVTVIANSDTSTGLNSVGGGGIANVGTLAVTNSIITGNIAHSDMFGSEGSGGGIENQGTATVTSSVISDNTADESGGGFDDEQVGTFSLFNVLITGNQGGSDGGGIYSQAPCTVSHCTIEDNAAGVGGGCGFDSQSATLIGTTIVNNTATSGAACFDGGNSTRFINCTIANNTATDTGGVAGGGPISLADTIVAGNAPINFYVYPPNITSLGHNLIDQDSLDDPWIASDKVGSSFAPLDPMLAPLANYGGTQPTLVPLAGSPALAGGLVALVAAGDTTDERGLPRIVNGAVDIGAVEVQASPIIHVTAPAPQTFAPGGTDHVQLGTFSAPAGSGRFFVIVSWGDGTPDTSFTPAAAGSLGAANHHFALGGAENVRVSISDSAGDLSNSLQVPVTVKFAPTITFVVNTTKDQTDPAASKTVSLRDAVNRANSHPGPVSITFDPIVFARQRTITLDGSPLELSNAFGLVRITGTAAGLTIDGNGNNRDLLIDRNVTAKFASLFITGGAANTGFTVDNAGEGGGIFNGGTLTLFSCTVSNNYADNRGGGIFNNGVLTLVSDTISENAAPSQDGGGIYNSGSLSVQSCKIIGNQTGDPTEPYDTARGGGIANTGSLTVSETLFTGNDAGANGSAVSSDTEASFTRCTFSQNSASVIYNSGVALVNHCTLVKNLGEAFDNGGQATLMDSTLSGNLGAAINNYGTATIAECTIAGNSSQFAVGGIYNADTADVTISNSIVAGNTAVFDPAVATVPTPNVQGAFNSLGHNLIGTTDGSRGWIKSDLTGTNAKPLSANLSPLSLHGGSMLTQVPLVGSPAIGAGSPALVPSGITTDVRGFARIVKGAVDIGSVELPRSAVVTVTPPAKQSAVAGVAEGLPLGSFVDPQGKGPFQVDVLWGDGSVDSIFTVAAQGSLGSLNHTFINTGALTGGITVTDTAGNVSNFARFTIQSAAAPVKTIVVNTTNDRIDPLGSKIVSLRDAIAIADASFGPANIEFDPTIFSSATTIRLNGEFLDLNDNHFGLIKINAPAAGLTIDATSMFIDYFPQGTPSTPGVFSVESGVSAALTNITVTNGFVSGISNGGNLTLTRCAVTNDRVLDIGGIYNGGTMTVIDSTIADNSAHAAWIGKGPSGGFCGGIDNLGTMTLVDSTISGNAAVYDGGISNSGALTMTNCTVANSQSNPAYGTYDGGVAIDNEGTLALNDSTIASNTAAGIVSVRGSITIANTIVAGNLGPDVSGPFKSKGHNLIGEIDGSTGWISTDLTGTAAHPRNAHLSPLGAHGGPTQTIVPLSGSPALAAGAVNLIPSGIATDQRGLPRVLGGLVDIGAVETH